VLTVGAAGGPKIITQVLLAIVRRHDFGQSLKEAVAAPRIHQQWVPNVLMVEDALPANLIKKLEGFGHKIEKIGTGGVTQAIEVEAKGKLIGVHDPRVPRKAANGKRTANPSNS